MKEKRRILITTALLAAAVVVITFLNYQVDDEYYIGAFDYEEIHEGVDDDDGVLTIREDMGVSVNTLIAAIPAMHVDAGTFVLDTDHQGDADISVIIYDGNTKIDSYVLPAGEQNTRHAFSSEKNMYNLRAEFIYTGEGNVTLKRSILYSVGRAFYSDTIVFGFLIIAAMMILAACMIKSNIMSAPLKDRIVFAALILFLILSNYLYYRPINTGATDISFHLARIEATYNEFKRGGQVPIVMYTDALGGRGMIGILYPYLTLFIPAALRMLHVSPDCALRCFFILIDLATCATSYYAAKRITGNRYISTATMMLYCLLTYRITTMTYRFAYGESQAFIFFPLVILGLYEVLAGDKKRWPILTIGMTGLIQCHIISTIQAAVVCAVFGILYIVPVIKELRIIQVILSAISTVLLNLWYIVPFLTYYRSDIDVSSHLVTAEMSYITYYFTDLLRMFPNDNPGEQMHHQMGLIGLWIILLTGYAVYIQLKKDEREPGDRFALALLALGTGFIFMATKAFPWDTMSKFGKIYHAIQNVQFTTRFYLSGEIMILFGAVISIAGYHKDRTTYRNIILAATLIIAGVQGYAICDSYLSHQDPFIGARKARYAADTANGFVDDYVPEGYWDGADFPETPESPDAKIVEYYHDGLNTMISYESDKETYVDLPLVYYTGYKASSADGTVYNIVKGNGGCTRIELSPSDNPLEVDIDFDGADSWRIAMMISVLSAIGFISLCVHMRNKRTSD